MQHKARIKSDTKKLHVPEQIVTIYLVTSGCHAPVKPRSMRRSCAHVWGNNVAAAASGLLRGRDVGHDPVHKFTEERPLEENLVE